MLANKLAVVTGANRGIGLEIVRTFIANGSSVIACVRSTELAQEKILQEFDSEEASKISFVKLDLASEESIKSAIKVIASKKINIDILVNNAGIASGGLFQMVSSQDVRNVFDINFFGPLLFTQGIARLMQRNKCGSIVNISSTAAYISDVGTLVYGASKAALMRASSSMASELATHNIRVNSIAPTITKTEMFDQMAPMARDKLIESSAFKRAAEPRDVANVVLFLASDLASFVTGQTIRVDGGII